MPSPLSLCLFSFVSISSALPWSGALPTLAYDAADWTPVPTISPQPQNLKRDFFPHNVCGFIGGRANEPALCSASSTCVWDTVHSVVGCCPIDAPCTVGVYTGCVDKNSAPQTIADPAIFTCSGESVCYQNTYPGGYRQYGCGSSSDLATNVETTFSGQPTNKEVWVVSTSFFTTTTSTSSTASITSAPLETTKLTTLVGEIGSTLTTIVGEVSSGVVIVLPTSTVPVIPTFFPNTTISTMSANSTASIDVPSISTSSRSGIDAPHIQSSTSINVSPPQISSATSTNTNSPTLPTISPSSTSSNANINPVGILQNPTASSGASAAGDSASSETSTSTNITPSSNKNRNIVIGTTVGVGGAAILGIIGVVLFFLRRRRQQQQQQQPRQGETALLTPMRPARSDDSFRINFDYPLEDDIHSPNSPTQQAPTFPPPPNSENNAPAPNLFPFSSFPLPPTTLPSQQTSPTRTIVSPISREETRRNMPPLTTTFDNYPSVIREAISVVNSPRKYTPVPQDDDGAWREESREVEKIRKATRAPRFGESTNISGSESPAPAMPGPGMVNMF